MLILLALAVFLSAFFNMTYSSIMISHLLVKEQKDPINSMYELEQATDIRILIDDDSLTSSLISNGT